MRVVWIGVFSWIVLISFDLNVSASAYAQGVANREVSDRTLLVDAIEKKDWELASKLLRDEPNRVREVQPDGMTSVHWAVMHRRPDWVRRLVTSGADLDRPNEYGVVPIALASLHGDVKTMEALLNGKPKIEVKSQGGETPLMIAARAGVPSIVRMLIAQGADVNAKERRGQTALMWAAAEGHHEVVRVLLESGAEVETKLGSGFNAMMFACREGRIEVVQVLLEHGVDVQGVMEPKNSGGRGARNGMSGLLMAVESGHFELALKLVGWGADPNDCRSGYGPLHALTWVRRANNGDGIDGDPPPKGSGSVSSLQFIREMVDLGAEVDLKLKEVKHPGKAKLNPNGATPFLMASKTVDLPMMKLLLELGADPMAANADGCTPLLAASGVGTVAVDEEPGTEEEVMEAIDLLLKLGGNIHEIDRNGESVMHGAAYRAYPKEVAHLAARGSRRSDWDHENKHGWTPMKIAEGYRPGSLKPSPAVQAALLQIPR